MNSELLNYTRNHVDDTEYVPVLSKIFSAEVLDMVSRNEVLDILHSEKFMDIERISSRLVNNNGAEEDGVSLLDVLFHFNIDYISIVIKRLQNVGVTKYSLLNKLKKYVDEYECVDLVSFAERISANVEFLEFWKRKIDPIIDDLLYLLDVLGIDSVIDELGSNLIKVDLGDDIKFKNRVLKFEKFICDC